MKPVFDRITRLSIHYKWITLVGLIALILLGIYAATQLNIELLPSIEFPSTYILARSHGGTGGDLMLQAYTLPIEKGTGQVEGVLNRESSTSTGFAFLQIQNEFGLDQTAVRSDLQAVLDQLPLPLRTIAPPPGSSAEDLIGELTPDIVLYLYAYSLQEDIDFLPQLSSAVWQSFSAKVLGALPPQTFEEIDQALADELRARAVGEPQPLPNVQETAAPSLPFDWQMDRFETALDLIELTGIRSLADIFNDFLNDGIITGPLGTVSDLTLEDIRLILVYSEHCAAFTSGDDVDVTVDTCSMLRYLDGETLAALLTQYQAGADGILSEEVKLPDSYLQHMKLDDRNRVAAALTAQFLTGSSVSRDAVLPDEWRFEKPQTITFSMSDIPLGVISISADETQFDRSDLEHIVENEIVPQLAALESVADISIEGGEEIRRDLLNAALEAEGLPLLPANSEAETLTPAAGEENNSTGEPAANDPEQDVQEPLEEGPALPASWSAFASALPDIEELDTADDLLKVPGLLPSQLFNQAASMGSENPAVAPFVNRALSDLTPDVLFYLAEHEADFFNNLSLDVLKALSAETLAALPEEVQKHAASTPAPVLGEFWLRLGTEPEFQQIPLATASDLAVLEGGIADALNKLVLESPEPLKFYSAQLVNDLSPEVVSYLVAEDAGLLSDLDPRVLCYFSAEVLNADEVKNFWSDTEINCLFDGSEIPLAAIAAGEEPTAVQRLTGGQDTANRVDDPNAPPLPDSWSGIASFVGAEELDSADDLFYTVDNGQTRTPSELLNAFIGQGENYIRQLPADVLLYVTKCGQAELCEENFFNNLSDAILLLLSDETASQLSPDIQERREAARLGTYEPQEIVTRTDGNNSLILQILKQSDANTVTAWAEVEEVLEEMQAEHPEITFAVAFEQASYIQESINGVAREGGLGAVMAVIVILIFLNFSIRSTLVTAVSIPTSVALAFVLMKWLPGNVHQVIAPLADDSAGIVKGLIAFVLRLFPEDISLNIMTLSGLTVAIGRVVDDAIVVLENIYRNIQKGEDQLEAVLHGTRDVSVAIFAATVTTVVVFLPIGLFGGIIGEFFLPFGLAVTYALLSSFMVAITVVPLLAYLFISKSSLPKEHKSQMEDGYRRGIRWALNHRWIVIAVGTLAFITGVFILSQLPTAFLPSFGEPTITVDISLPGEIDGVSTTLAVTDAKVRHLEASLQTLDGIRTIQSAVGGGGNDFAPSEAITETVATVTIYVDSQETLDSLTPMVRQEAEKIFNDLDHDGTLDPEQDNVTVSGASLSEQGFGGFAVVLSGDPANPPTLAELKQYDPIIMSTLEDIEGITNVESSLEQVAGTAGDVSQTYIRIDGIPAVRYTAELETEDTLGLTSQAINEVKKLDLPDNMTISEGFESEMQTEGFRQTFVSMGIAIIIVYFVMVLTFGSFVHPVTILFSLPLAVVGAAVGLAVTGRVLGLSSVVGLLMLVGIVVTNAIVLIDRVQTNRKQLKLNVTDAVTEGGTTRLRPILMTAIATMVALVPLAVGLSEGAIIAAELGTVVIGGLFSSTVLTLVVVPVVYSLFDQAQTAVKKRIM